MSIESTCEADPFTFTGLNRLRIPERGHEAKKSDRWVAAMRADLGKVDVFVEGPTGGTVMLFAAMIVRACHFFLAFLPRQILRGSLPFTPSPSLLLLHMKG